MNLRLPFRLALLAATAIALHAAPSDDDDEDIDYLGYYSKSKDSLTFGYQMRQGAKVHFGNIGQVQPSLTSTNAAGQTVYTYTNGSLTIDAARPYGAFAAEKDVNGNLVPTTNGRYTILGTDANGNPTITVDFLAYQAGQTRYWGFSSLSQISSSNPSQVIMSQYTATSDGASLDGKRKLSSGVELQLKKQLNSVESKVGFSLAASFSLNSLSSKTAGSVQSTLRLHTDTYATADGVPVPTSLSGTIISAPTFASYSQSDGTVNPSGLETTVPLLTSPVYSSGDTIVSKTNVNGTWRINGAYYTLRLGPEVNAQVFRNISLNAGAGFSLAYVGTNYNVSETLTVNLYGTDESTTDTEAGTSTKFLTGYYANLGAAWEANERTGFYAGLNYESFGSYTQQLGSRLTKIDLSGTVGFRGGISIKF